MAKITLRHRAGIALAILLGRYAGGYGRPWPCRQFYEWHRDCEWDISLHHDESTRAKPPSWDLDRSDLTRTPRLTPAQEEAMAKRYRRER